MPFGRPTGLQPLAGLSATRGLATLRGYLVFLVTIDYVVILFFNIMPLISELTSSPGTAGNRLKSYKNNALDSAEMRRRREEEGVQLRKQKREEQLFKRRNVNTVEQQEGGMEGENGDCMPQDLSISRCYWSRYKTRTGKPLLTGACITLHSTVGVTVGATLPATLAATLAPTVVATLAATLAACVAATY
jgi:hypothetical protein